MYELGDRFCARGCRDGNVYVITDVVHEPYDDKTYTLEGTRYTEKYLVSDSAINTCYYKV